MSNLGDTSTLLNPEVVEEIKDKYYNNKWALPLYGNHKGPVLSLNLFNAQDI